MEWRNKDHLLVALVKAVYHHRLLDPSNIEYGDRKKCFGVLLEEEPWSSHAALKDGNYSPLYLKMLDVANDFEAKIEAERTETGGGQPKRPHWWQECEKELHAINDVCSYLFAICT